MIKLLCCQWLVNVHVNKLLMKTKVVVQKIATSGNFV